MLKPNIITLEEKTLVGKSIIMTFNDNKTSDLWRSFMPYRNQIKNRISTDLYSLQVYDKTFENDDFNPHITFTKYALVEVSQADELPENMTVFELPKGLYAVFNYKGMAKDVPSFFYQIMKVWLPQSNYNIDDRPHFELIKENYNPMDENAEEEFFIPIKLK